MYSSVELTRLGQNLHSYGVLVFLISSYQQTDVPSVGARTALTRNRAATHVVYGLIPKRREVASLQVLSSPETEGHPRCKDMALRLGISVHLL